MHDEIERRQALDDARRLVVQTLLLFQIVEQGRLPVQTLRRCCAEPVLDALGPIIPAAARGSLAAPKVTRVRVQAIGDNLVHAAAVARRPDGQPAGYVVELRRDGIGHDWQVHQLTRHRLAAGADQLDHLGLELRREPTGTPSRRRLR